MAKLGHIADSEIFSTKYDSSIPKEVKELVSFFQFKDPTIEYTKEILFGSYNLRLQPYPSDLDTICNVHFYNDISLDEAINVAVRKFQEKVLEVEKNDTIFLTDIKCGKYDDGEAIHWTASEILKGRRNGNIPDFNGHLGHKEIHDGFKQRGHNLLKLDLVVPYLGRYIELTCVYILFINNESLNIRPDELTKIAIFNSLKADAKKQYKKNKLLKVFKRIFSASKVIKDIETAQMIEKILTSNVSLLSAIKGDIDTLELLVKQHRHLNLNVVNDEFNTIKEKMSNILDINFNVELINYLLDNVYNKLKINDYVTSRKILEHISDILNNVVNTECMRYMVYIGWKTYPKKYL